MADWKLALLCVGMECGFIDVSGNPIDKRAVRLIRAGKTRFMSQRKLLSSMKQRFTPKQ